MTLSGTRFSGESAGALFVDKNLSLRPIHAGGGHGRARSCTENVPAFGGLWRCGEIAATRAAALGERVSGMRERLESGLHELGAVVFGERAPRVPNTTYFAFPNIDGETLVVELDKLGFATAAGAACSSASTEPSATLLAMGSSRARTRRVRESRGRKHGRRGRGFSARDARVGETPSRADRDGCLIRGDE